MDLEINVCSFSALFVHRHGVNNVTTLVEMKKGQLVVIPNDVEKVMLLPDLCRKMGESHTALS